MASVAVPRPRAALTVLLVTLLSALAGVAGVPQAAHAADGDVIISGGSWLQGLGVDVHTNGGNSATYYQCVELPKMRLYPKLGWPAIGVAGNGGAAYIPEGSPGLVRYNPGSGYVPVPGDLVIENPHGTNPYGHVAVVDHTLGGTIWAVEQNGSRSGWHPYTFNGSVYGGGYGPVKAILHAPQNSLTNPPGGVGDDLAQARTPLLRWSSGTDRSSLVGPAPAGYSLQTPLGLLANAAPAGGWPLYACVAGTDAFTSRDKACEGQRVVALLGYAYAAPPASVPSRLLYRCRTAAPAVDRFDSTDPACEGQTVDTTLGYVVAAAPVLRYASGADRASATTSPGPAYRADSFLGYLPLQSPAGGRAVYGCTTGTDGFLSLDAGCEGQRRVGRVGYAYPTKPAGVPARPIYRCTSIDAAYGERFESADPGCEGQRPTGTLGYALSSLGVPATTAAVSSRALRVTAQPRIVNAYVGATATCIPGFTGATALAYAWVRDGIPLRRQRVGTYAVTPGDLGHMLACTAVASTVSNSATATSAGVRVQPPRLRVVTAPVVRGSLRVGSVLRATRGTWAPNPLAYRYQWLRDGTAVSRASASAYRATTRDRGHRLSVRVTALPRQAQTTHSATSSTSLAHRVF